MMLHRVSWKHESILIGPQREDRRVGEEGRTQGRDRSALRGRSRDGQTLLQATRRARHPGAQEGSRQETEARRESQEVAGQRPRRAPVGHPLPEGRVPVRRDRKSTRLNSSHANISYAVFCLKKKRIATPSYFL